MKRFLALLLAALMLTGVFIACSDPGKEIETSETDTAYVDTSDPRMLVDDELPDKLDLGKREFRIFTYNEMGEFFIIEESTGEVIDDAVYDANLKVEERFNVDIVNVISPATTDTEHNAQVKSTILTGSDDYEIAENHDCLSGALSLEKLFANYYNIEHLNFDKPWWPSDAVNSLTFMGQMYLGSSNMSYKGLHQTRMIYFNKDLADDYRISGLYDMVFDDTWTLDQMISLSKDVYSDLDGGQTRDDGDLYGYISDNSMYTTMEGYGIEIVSKTDDELTVTVLNENTLDLVNKFYSLLAESEGGFITDAENRRIVFAEGRGLFAYGEFKDALTHYRMYQINYGMLPTPKLNDVQENYIGAYTDRFFVIPTTASDTEFIGLMIEAMSAEGYRLIIPAYYEIAMKRKYTFDDESVRVLDIINEHRILDFAYVYCNTFSLTMRDMLGGTNKTRDFTSYYEGKLSAFEKKLDTITESFDKMAEY